MKDVSKIGVGIAVFIWRDGKILMQKRKGSHGEATWSIPGGKLEFGESWEACGVREVREEVGVDIKNIRFLAVTNDVFESESKHYITIWLEADWAANEPKICEPDKLSDLAWHTLQDLPSPLFEPCYQNLRNIKPELFTN